MDALMQYIVSVISASLICSLVMSFLKNTAVQKQLRIICGLVLSITILVPISTLDISKVLHYVQFGVDDANTFTSEGMEMTQNAMADIIKREAEAYILSEAIRMNAEVSVCITVSEDEIPIPEAASVSGTISPFVRQQLADILHMDLGIPREKQVWTG